jgi:hypothetical protein
VVHGGDGVGEGRRLLASGDGVDLGLFPLDAFLESGQVVFLGYLVKGRYQVRAWNNGLVFSFSWAWAG